MKIIKWLFRIILLLILLLGLVISIILLIDRNKTNYLKSSNYPHLNNDLHLIKNVNIVPMNLDTILEGHSVLIRDGIIERIGRDLRADDVDIIDGQGLYLSPGLIDMHVHLWDKYELGLYLANGVTAIRNLWGIPMHLRIKKSLESKELIGPNLFVSSPKLTGPQDYGDDKVQLANPEQARNLVRQYKERGYDFVKTYAGITPDLMSAVLDQAEKENMDVVAHPSFQLPYEYHFHPQIATIEHAEDIVQQALDYQLDTMALNVVIAGYKGAGTSFSPTLTGYYKIVEMMDDPEILNSDLASAINPLMYDFDSKVQFQRWTSEMTQNPSARQNIYRQHQFHLYILNQLHRAGVTIVGSTDAGIGITAPGYSLHQELGFYKEAGLSNFEVLKTVTVNPSTTHEFLKDLGSIEEGKKANLLFTRQNPLEGLETLKKPVLVMVEGRLIKRETLDLFEENARNRKNFISTAIRYAEYLLKER